VEKGLLKLKLLTKKSIIILPKDEIIKYAAPLFFAGLLGWPMTLVPVFIGFITSPEQVSFYSLAISLSSFIYLGTLTAESAGLSVWSKYVNNSEISKLIYDYRLITKWGIILGSFLFMILLVTPKELVILLFEEKFLPIADILPILATVFFINLLTGPSESILKATSETVFILRTRLISGLITAIGIYPALKFWGIYGAISVYAFSAIIGGVLMYSYRLWSKYRIHPFDWVFLRMLLSLLSALAFVKFFIHSYLLGYSPIIVILTSFFLYLTSLTLLIFLFKVISKDESFLIKTFYSKLFH
jgi:O-antigen/teichoic acid export membrane protein